MKHVVQALDPTEFDVTSIWAFFNFFVYILIHLGLLPLPVSPPPYTPNVSALLRPDFLRAPTFDSRESSKAHYLVLLLAACTLAS